MLRGRELPYLGVRGDAEVPQDSWPDNRKGDLCKELRARRVPPSRGIVSEPERGESQPLLEDVPRHGKCYPLTAPTGRRLSERLELISGRPDLGVRSTTEGEQLVPRRVGQRLRLPAAAAVNAGH